MQQSNSFFQYNYVPWTCEEYSAAFWTLRRGRGRDVDVVADVLVEGDESKSSCCTCKISTYSSNPDELFVDTRGCTTTKMQKRII